MATKLNNNFNLSQNLFLQDFISKELFWFNPSWNSSSGSKEFIKFLQSQSKNYNDFLSFDDVKEFILNPFHSSGGSFSRSVSSDKINQYLDNIEFYQSELNKFTSTKIELTYYQVFGLLFTECYLDCYFNNFEDFKKNYADYLIQELNLKNNYSFDGNGNLIFWKSNIFAGFDLKNKKWTVETEKEEFGLLNNLLKLKNKLVFWMATGSWKTFMMMINTIQYLKYIKESWNPKLKVDNILIITPNKDLSDQHFAEFNKFWLFCNSLINKDIVKFVEINKFKMNSDGSSYSTKNKNKDGTFDAIDEYGDTNNLILIDEWHKSIQWWKDSSVQKKIRDLIWIKENSFTFEYSATYWQAVSNSDEFIQSEYSNSIIWNYSYKFFKDDNYGKNFILNNVSDKSSKSISDNSDLNEEQMIKILLSHIQQSLIFDSYKNNPQFKDYNIEKPLISIFWQKVQNKGKNKDSWKASDSDELDVSEVNQFINFLWKVLQDKIDISYIQQVLSDNSGSLYTNYLTNFNKDIDFSDLQWRIKSKKWLLNDSIFQRREDSYILKHLILKYVFEIESKTISDIIDKGDSLFLEVEKLKNNDLKEVWLRVSWQNNYFWLVYVWNPDDVVNWIQSFSYIKEWIGNNFRTQSDSLFKDINQWKLSMIVWSKKFIMGWNNYRVSTMWLLEIWKGQGPTIIQVLWRGVRLKWKNNSLKREVEPFIEIYNERTNSYEEINISLLQSLNIIWINANFMKTFEAQLEEEGILKTLKIPVKTKVIDIPEGLKILIPKKQLNKKIEQKTIKIVPKQFKEISESLFSTYKDLSYLKWMTLDLDERIKYSSKGEDWRLFYTPNHNEPFNLKLFVQSLIENEKMVALISWNKIYLNILEFKQSKKELNNIFIDINKEKEDILELFKLISWIYPNNLDFNYNIYLKNKFEFKKDYENFLKIQNINKIENLIILIFKQVYLKLRDKLKRETEEETLEWRDVNEISNKSSYWLIPKEQFIEIEMNWRKDKNELERDINEHLEKYIEETLIDLKNIVKGLHKNKEIIKEKELNSIYTPFIWFSDTLFENSDSFIKSYPVALNPWEYNFIEWYKNYIQEQKEQFKNLEIYILRNQSKTWVGFYWNYGWFYPDFIIWKLNKITDQQEIHFIDPKGMRNLWKESDKVNLWKKLESFKKEKGVSKITSWLYSYNSTFSELKKLWKDNSKEEIPNSEEEFKEKYHILFKNDFNF